MIETYIAFFLGFLFCTAALFLGYLLGAQTTPKPMQEHSTRPLMTKPAGIFKGDESGVGAVQRPTAQELRKWAEKGQNAQNKEAIAETLAEDPELVKLKALREQFVKTAAQ